MKLYGMTKENKILTNENDRPVATVEFDITPFTMARKPFIER